MPIVVAIILALAFVVAVAVLAIVAMLAIRNWKRTAAEIAARRGISRL